jgi:hypothetical protein
MLFSQKMHFLINSAEMSMKVLSRRKGKLLKIKGSSVTNGSAI